GKPVVLLYGRVPSFRALKRGMVGRDVRQLNRNLAALGYARWSIASSSHFSGATARGVKRLQAALKVKRTGKLGLGETVFAPRQLRITKLQATLGTPLAPGAVLGHASSTARRVVVSLDAAQQSNVAPGNRVLITLPTGRSTP